MTADGMIRRICARGIAGALLLMALALSMAMPERGLAVTPQRIAAVVNDDVVSLQDLNERLALVAVTSGIGDDPEARSRLAPQVLRQLIEETLQLQEARRLDLAVTQAELNEALNTIAQRNNMTTDTLRQFMASSGVNFETLQRQLRAQIAWVKVVNRQIRPRVSVTVDQLEMAVQEYRLSQGQPELLLSEIVLPVDTPEQEPVVAGDAQRIVQTVREGAGFDSLARQVSVAASAEQGGDLGWVRAASIPPELMRALDELQPGEVSAPIRSSIGFHIFWLRDRRLAPVAGTQGMDGVEVRLTQILFAAEDGVGTGELEELRARAAALRERLDDCQSMTEVASELAAPASGDLGWLRIGDLPPEFGQTVLSLPVGEVSPPLQGPAGIHLLMVCERRDPQGVAAPQRDQIAQRLENERIERLGRRYLRDLRQQAFVEVRL